MFRGQFPHTVDAKGRVSLPARFRETLSDHGEARFVLTPSPLDPCLHLYPMRVWEDFEQRVAELPNMDTNVVRFRRMYVSAAVECELDKTGRVLIPPHLREKSRLKREALWAGMGRYLELWSKDQWEAALSMTDQEERQFRQVMEQLRI